MTKDLFLVRVPEQIGELYLDMQRVRLYPLSTAVQGVGSEVDSFKTPLGKHRICEKIGQGLPNGMVLKGRVASGEIWSPDPRNPLSTSREDLILSRILWLEGIEESNLTTKDRLIYIHGTNHEDKLGKPSSGGCIRMSNRDIIELFELVNIGTVVEISLT